MELGAMNESFYSYLDKRHGSNVYIEIDCIGAPALRYLVKVRSGDGLIGVAASQYILLHVRIFMFT